MNGQTGDGIGSSEASLEGSEEQREETHESAELTRREFVVGAAAACGAVALSCSDDDTGQDSGVADSGPKDGPGGEGKAGDANTKGPSPLVIIAIDALHPGYLDLDANGLKGGKDGNWLMPNLQKFFKEGGRISDARDHLPAATDPNHLNAVAGTNTGQTGVNFVGTLPTGWKSDKKIELSTPHLSMARDGKGRQVKTLMELWGKKWPKSKTAFVSGKGWIADEYDKDKKTGYDPGIDIIVQGGKEPAGVPKATAYKHSFYDPPGDKDAKCDPESAMAKAFDDGIYKKDDKALNHFPPDKWVVDATLKVLEKDGPGLTWVLMAQVDDAQHALGCAWDPDEFEKRSPPYVPPVGCKNPADPQWQYVSKRNRHVFRAPVLDTIRDADEQFGRLIAGIKKLPAYKDATVAVYSDHGHVTFLLQKDWKPSDKFGKSTDAVGILSKEGLLTKDEQEWKGFSAVTGCSGGMLLWHPDKKDRAKVVVQAKTALLAHKATNPETGKEECPWWVLDLKDMKDGLTGVADKGELYHDYFAAGGKKEIIWPDLFLLAKNGWQLTIYDGVLGNIGVDIPVPLPPVTVFLGGHGSTDTMGIVLGMTGPGIAKGKVIKDPGYKQNYRLADMPVTLAARAGLTFPHTTVGQDRSTELKG